MGYESCGMYQKKSVVEIQVVALASLKMTALLGNWAVWSRGRRLSCQGCLLR
jgi:hypothetical protein